MAYRVKEIFYTLQGEGARAGRPAVFCRFSGCNLWSGQERHRARAVCQFCDTDFVSTNGPGGGRFSSPEALAGAVARAWAAEDSSGQRYVVCTGGEPLLQLDGPLIDALHGHGFEVGIETNGTRPVPDGVDWVCMSPKAGADRVVGSGDELKLVYPQVGLEPTDVEDLHFAHFFLQPMDGADRVANTVAAVRYCLAHPRWRLSVQTHKVIGIP